MHETVFINLRLFTTMLKFLPSRSSIQFRTLKFHECDVILSCESATNSLNSGIYVAYIRIGTMVLNYSIYSSDFL